MGIFSLRSMPGVAKAWRKRPRLAAVLRRLPFITAVDEDLAGERHLQTEHQPGMGMLPEYQPNLPGGLEGMSWGQKLTHASSQLGTISASTEDEFLAIGERLQDFHQRAGQITSIVNNLSSHLGGEKGAGAISNLAGLLDDLKNHLDEAQNQSGRQSLAEILDRLQQVNAPLTCFGQMDKSLRMFSTYTKIESARLGARAVGFDSLAKDVIRLSGEVSGKADTVMQQKNELAAVIQNALTTLMNIGADQQSKILSILEKTNQNLDSLADIVERSYSSAGIISVTSAEVTENLGQVVFSLQAHDTVRQQIQHVAEALDELAAHLPESGAGGQPAAGTSAHSSVETGTVCEIQSAQLRHSSAEFLRAVENIIVNLREIAAKETGMADDTRALLGKTDQTGASFFTEMGNDVVVVLGMVTAAAMTNRKLSEVMTSAADTVGGIFSFVDDIETIAYDIKLIALNFLIQAAQLGSEGGGLGVMAEAINRLSEEARDQAAGIAATLAEIKEVTDAMCQGAMVNASAMEVRIKEMRQGLESMLATLQEMNTGMTEGLTQANTMVQDLSADIDEVTAGITVHHKVAAILREAETILEDISTEAKAQVPETEWSAAMEKLHASDKRYTMHSERHIHASVVNAQTPWGATDQPAIETALPMTEGPVPVSDGPDLGDNVELF
jgi:methyl-accepting chemotaxis protein/flagellin-specific chaperone FliS